MDAVTYPERKVVDFIMEHLVPLRVPSDAEPLSRDFNIKWTPTLVIVDENGKEHHRTVGFLPPEECIPSLLLGIAKTCFELDRFQEALKQLDTIISDHPASHAAPEAIYLRGVAAYKSTHDPRPLKQAYEQLQAKYPDGEWTKRALPYRLLPV